MSTVLTVVKNKITGVCSALFTKRSALQLALMACVGVLAFTANAQDITMPTVAIDGIDADSSGDTILITIIKFVARIGIWAAMVMAGFVALKKILSSWNEQKQNDQGRWGAVISDSIGSIILVILVIAVGTWLLTFLA